MARPRGKVQGGWEHALQVILEALVRRLLGGRH